MKEKMLDLLAFAIQAVVVALFVGWFLYMYGIAFIFTGWQGLALMIGVPSAFVLCLYGFGWSLNRRIRL
jgi:hypothetical protein